MRVRFDSRVEALLAEDREEEVEGGEADPAAVCSRAQASRVGEVFSTAHDSRCRMMGTCASQHETEQKIVPVRLRLHVETLQTQ